jgi:hypothetical protein
MAKAHLIIAMIIIKNTKQTAMETQICIKAKKVSFILDIVI